MNYAGGEETRRYRGQRRESRSRASLARDPAGHSGHCDHANYRTAYEGCDRVLAFFIPAGWKNIQAQR